MDQDWTDAMGTFEAPLRPQWQEAGGSYEALQSAAASVRAALARATDLPEVLYEKAPGAYAGEVLPALRDASAWLTWAIRVISDEALSQRSLPQREVAEAAGVAFTTAQRWARDPAVSRAGTFGPSLTEPPPLPDGRRSSRT